MTQLNTSFLWGVRTTFRDPKGVMADEVPQNGKISGGGKNGGRKGLSSAIIKEERVGGA